MVRDAHSPPDGCGERAAVAEIEAPGDGTPSSAKSSSPRRPWLRARIASLDATERTNIVMLVVLCAVTPLTFEAVPGNAWLVAGYAAMAALLVAAPRIA